MEQHKYRHASRLMIVELEAYTWIDPLDDVGPDLFHTQHHKRILHYIYLRSKIREFIEDE